MDAVHTERQVVQNDREGHWSTYRRNRIPDGTFFFTVNLRDRQSELLVTYIDALREAVRAARAAQSFLINAWVILPDHLHCIWTLPDDDNDFPSRWQAIRIGFSRSLPSSVDCRRDPLRPRERGIWQRRYWEHTIRAERHYAAHMDYIHFNPVKHAYVQNAADWPHSTFRRCVKNGLYPPDWVGTASTSLQAGEQQ